MRERGGDAGGSVDPAPAACGASTGAAAQGPSSRWRTGGWLEVEGETDVWGPHVSEWRNKNSRGVLVHTEDAYAYNGLAVGLGTHKT